MFVTHPEFGEPAAQLLGDPNHTYWHAVVLTGDSPWYLLTYDSATSDGGSMRNSIAISWEATLGSAVDSLGPDAIRGLCSIRTAGSAQTWTMRQVQTLWLPASSEEATTGPVLFSFVGDPLVYSSHYVVVPQDCRGRVLLLSLDASV